MNRNETLSEILDMLGPPQPELYKLLLNADEVALEQLWEAIETCVAKHEHKMWERYNLGR